MNDEQSGSPPAGAAPPPPPPEGGGSAADPGHPPGSPPPAGGEAGAATGGPSNEERSWAMLCHMLALAGLVFPIVLNVAVPLIMWQMKKNESAFVDDQGREAVNFQITVSLVLVVLFGLSVVPLVGCLTLPAMIIAGIAALVFAIIGGLKANEGVAYRYPVCLRLIT